MRYVTQKRIDCASCEFVGWVKRENNFTCPSCGDQWREKRDLPGHGQLHSIHGVRNYYDEGMDVDIRDFKHKCAEMEKRGYTINPDSGSAWETHPEVHKEWKHPARGRLVRKNGVFVGENE